MEKIRKVNPRSEVALFVKAARAALNESGDDFGHRFGRGKGAVSGWEVGASEPTYDQLRKMSELSHVPLPGIARILKTPEQSRTPVTGDARLGDKGFYEVAEAAHGSDGWVEYPWYEGRYALRCKGDSMRDRIMHGDYVVIDRTKPTFEGYLVAVHATNGRRMIKTLNRIFPDKSVELTSINRSHDPIILFEDEVEHMHAVMAILPPNAYHFE